MTFKQVTWLIIAAVVTGPYMSLMVDHNSGIILNFQLEERKEFTPKFLEKFGRLWFGSPTEGRTLFSSFLHRFRMLSAHRTWMCHHKKQQGPLRIHPSATPVHPRRFLATWFWIFFHTFWMQGRKYIEKGIPCLLLWADTFYQKSCTCSVENVYTLDGEVHQDFELRALPDLFLSLL